MTEHRSEAERRRQILRAARGVIVEKGFRAARMDDVARRAGLSKGAVYFYFPSKDAIFQALAEQEHRQMELLLDGIRYDDRPPREKLEGIVEVFLRHFMELRHPPVFFLIMAERASRHDDLQADFARIHDHFLQSLASIVDEGVAAGCFRPIDPRVVAQVLKAISDGLALETAVGVRPEGRELAQQATHLLLGGILMPQEQDAR